MNGYSILTARKEKALGAGYTLRVKEKKRSLQFFWSRCIYKRTVTKNET